MELASSSWALISAVLVFCFGMMVGYVLARPFGATKKRVFFLYIWHTFFCVVYLFYAMNNGGDAIMYYHTSLSGNSDLTFGTAGVKFITELFSYVMGMSLLGVFLCFNIFGYVGLLAFDAALRSGTAGKSAGVHRLASLVVFLPSASFWSAAIGKDALSFMAAGFALWAAQRMGRRGWLMAFSVALMLLVRPHIAALMVMSLAMSMLVQPRVPLLQRVFLGGASFALAAAIVPFAMNYAKLGSGADLSGLVSYVDSRQSQNMVGGGGIDISSMSPPMKLFTYLFRPLPYEAHNITSLASSMDNVLLLVLMIVGIWGMLKRRGVEPGPNRMFLWIYSLSCWIILAITTANLGISVRQKWMFTPMLIFLFITYIGRRRAKGLVENQASDSEVVASGRMIP